MDHSNIPLLASLKKGKKEALETIYKKYYGELFVYGNSLIKNEEATRDILQNIFLRMWENHKNIIINTSLRSYLYNAVRNKCIDYIKHENVQNNFRKVINLGDSYLHKKLLDSDKEIDEKNDFEKKLELVNKAIEKLPPERKEIFKMSRLHRMSNQQIADALNLSKRTVETQIYRALISLRKEFSKK